MQSGLDFHGHAELQLRRKFELITSAGWRVGKIVADLKSFSRPTDSASGTTGAGNAIGWAIRTTEHEFRHRARLTQELDALPRAVADEARLGQVSVNLLINAAQAIAPDASDQVLCDLMMPVMTGIEFYEQLMARDPAQAGRVTFMTGGAVTPGKDEAFLRSVPNPRLDTPFGIPEIQSRSARMLGAGSPAGAPQQRPENPDGVAVGTGLRVQSPGTALRSAAFAR